MAAAARRRGCDRHRRRWVLVHRGPLEHDAAGRNPVDVRSSRDGQRFHDDGPRGPARTDASVELLDAGPLEPRDGAALAWDGTELVVWGGAIEPANRGLTGPDRQFGDGAAFNPTTRSWRTMAPGPLPTNLLTPVAVATPDGVVIARGTNVARWNPTANTWTALDDAPAPVSDLTAVGTNLW